MVILLCLFLNTSFTILIISIWKSLYISATISTSIGKTSSSTKTPGELKNIFFPLALLTDKNHEWCFISSNPYLFFGSVTKIFFNKSLQDWLKKLGKEKSPLAIFPKSIFWLSSSKGRNPQTIVYKTIPLDQISTELPLYFLPVTISGAA